MDGAHRTRLTDARKADVSPTAPLIPEQRRESIVEHLQRERVLSYRQLTDLLGVSQMTVRRDVATLEDEGRVTATPGGAKLTPRLLVEASREVKQDVDVAQKRAIAREAIAANRIHMRDSKSYCAILIDNNNRKPLVRLHFNRAVKYIGIFDGKTETRHRIESLDHIYDHSERIRATAKAYATGAVKELSEVVEE